LLVALHAPFAAAEITSFDGFPVVHQLYPGERFFATITSDAVQGLLRPKWTRAMCEIGGWPTMYEFQNDIYLEFNAVNGHGGTGREGATGELVRLRSPDQGSTWERLDTSALGTRLYGEYVTRGDTLYRYEWITADWRAAVSTSTDGVNFTAPQHFYDDRYLAYDVGYDDASGKFYSTPHYIPPLGQGGDEQRQVHLIESTNGIDWTKVTTLHGPGIQESESIFHIRDDGSMIAMVRQKWAPRTYFLGQSAAAPYTDWTWSDGAVVLEGHHFFEVDGQLFVGSRAYLPGNLITPEIALQNQVFLQSGAPYTQIYRVEDNLSLTPWAVLDSTGDNSYPVIVATDDEVLIAYYSQHEDLVDKVYLAAFDKDVFLNLHHTPEPSAFALAAVGLAALAYIWRKRRQRAAL
jgi:hypothetical protein